MSSFEAELKKTIKAIIRLEAKKKLRRERELDYYFRPAAIRRGEYI